MPDKSNQGTKRTPRDESPLPSPESPPSLPEGAGFIPPHGGYQNLLREGGLRERMTRARLAARAR